jgi:FKBP-type peptidyl-prolyl cis-trans isomerase
MCERVQPVPGPAATQEIRMTPTTRVLSLLPLACALALAGCAHSKGAAPAPAAIEQAAPATRVHRLASGLVYEDLVVGDGKMADPGLLVTVNYTGWLTDGTKFDSSFDHGRPYKFQLGTGAVIPGWDQGIKGMRVGGKRKLTIPSDLAYGPEGSGTRIPPNSILVFEVQLLGVE